MSEEFDFETIYQHLKQLDEEKELSPYEKNIFDFISVIKQQPNLLNAEDKLSLKKLLLTLPDNIEKISNQIADWYEKLPHINEVISKVSTYSNQKGAGNRTVEITEKEWKELIENVVRQSETKPSNDQSSPSNNQSSAN